MFKNREEAGEKLAQKLKEELAVPKEDYLILGIPRGGVVVGKKVSELLKIPFEVLVVKKIPSPENQELAIGAIGEGGIVVWDEDLCRKLGVTSDYRQEIVKKRILELEDKKEFFRKGEETLSLNGKKVIIVDDGIATGATIKTAISVASSHFPSEITVAVPIVAQETLKEIKMITDKVVYLEAPAMLFSVGEFYEDFEQISDEEVGKIL